MRRIKKEQLTLAVDTAKGEAREALQAVYDEHNHGQKKKLVKNERVKAIFDRFGVEYEEE
ncbi:MAG: hypothetical protein IJY93_04200 [Clostridia bacterium]|nr:hypothetical protein [Clostridia bacterium]